MEGVQSIISRLRASGQDTDHQNQVLQMKNLEKSKKLMCSKCRDTGWELTEHGTYKRCECYEKERLKKLWENSGINPEQNRMTFKNYETKNEMQKNAKQTATKYYQSAIKGDIGSIAFIGQVGSGKTHLAVAIALNLLEKGIQVKYMPYRDTITKIKMNMKDDENYYKILTPYQQCKLLFIDDLFKGKINDSDINIMFELINYRYNANLPIMITSEYNSERMLDFDEAIGSRILQMCKNYTVEFYGQENNYRLRGA